MKIGLLDHMGYGNLGDAAIQEVVIGFIKQCLPAARLVGFSLVPGDTEKRHGIPCYPILRWHPTLENTAAQAVERKSFKSRLKSGLRRNPLINTWAKPVLELAREAVFWVRSYRRLRTLDLLLISGGGQLGDLWRGPWSHPFTIFKFSLLTKLARKKLYFLNVGAGPLGHPMSRFFVRWALRLADYRSFRDEESKELVQSLGVKATLHVYPDPAYALDVRDLLNAASPDTAMPIVGLNPFGFCDPRIWPRKDVSLYKEFLEKIARFSAWLLEQGYNLRVFTTEVSVDRYAIEDLKVRLSSLVSPELIGPIFSRPSESVKDVLREMSKFDFIVTSKFHGIIFSHLLRKPVIALSYHRKMDVAMQAVGQSRFCADVESFDVDWLTKAFRSLIHESGSIKAGFAAVVEANAAKLSQQFNSLFLPDQPQSWADSQSSPVRKRADNQETP